jgi:hypothetical protein
MSTLITIQTHNFMSLLPISFHQSELVSCTRLRLTVVCSRMFNVYISNDYNLVQIYLQISPI